MLRPIIAALVALSLVPAPAAAAPDRSGTVSGASTAFAWEGALATGRYWDYDANACSHAVDHYCDQTLVKLEAAAGAAGDLDVAIGDYLGPQCLPVPTDGSPVEGNGPCDFSLWLYESDAAGKPGRRIGRSTNDTGVAEDIHVADASPGYYLVVVFYYTVAASSYEGSVNLTNLRLPAPLQLALDAAGRATAHRIPLRATCTAACTGGVVARVGRAQARTLGLRSRVVARADVRTTTPGPVRIVLRPSARTAARLAGARHIRLTLTAAVRGATRQRATAARSIDL